MKNTKLLLSIFAFAFLVGLFGAKQSLAQDYGYYVVDFQCDPLSCQEVGPLATQSAAEVNYYGACDVPPGDVNPFSESVIAVVGINGPCRAPYTPAATV